MENSKKIVGVIAALLPVIIFLLVFSRLGGCSGDSGGGLFGPSDNDYIDCAKQILSKSLRDPSSLQVHEAYVYEKDDYGSAIVYLDFSSKNGFGGSVRDRYYICVQHLTSDGKFSYSNVCSSIPANQKDYLMNSFKELNGFGQPKK